MYTEILGKLNVGDTYEINGEVFGIVAKPFGKWVTVKDTSGTTHQHKSSARVVVHSQVPVTVDDVNEGIDGLF